MLTINFSNSLDEFSNELLHPDALSIEKRVEYGEGIYLDVDFRIIPIMTSVCRPMLNYDGSRIKDGIITVFLTKGTFGGVTFKSRMDTNDTIFDYDSTGVGLRYISVLLWSSTINGQNPRLNKVFNKNEQEVKLTSLFTSTNRVFDTEQQEGCFPVLIENCISAETASYTEAIKYVDEDSVATREYIESLYGEERYVSISWSGQYRPYVTCNDGIVRRVEDCKPTLTDISVSEDGTKSIIKIEYISLDTLANSDYTTVIDNRYQNYDCLYICSDTAERLIGNRFGDITPLMYGSRFCLDTNRKPIVYRLDYHSSDRDEAEDIKSGISIGFEVEKEDEEALTSYDAHTLLEDTGWFKERDGSLDDDSGYELVSPVYDLMSDKLDNDIANSKELTELINADYGRRCGGHIHLSNGDSGNLLFDKISPWVPLLYALYVGRIGGEYCKIKKNEDIKNDHEKYQAIRILDNRIEIRIISAVPNVETLLWRRDLMRLIMNNLDWTPMKIVNQLLDPKSELYALLNKQYIPSQLSVKARLYAYFAAELLDDAHAVKQHIMDAVDHFSNTQIRHLKSYHFNVNK